MLTTEYELFKMNEDKSIHDMHSYFTSIINELHSFGKAIPRNKLVQKILSVLPGSFNSKVNVIPKAKDLQKQTIDELIGNLKTYEMMKKKYLEIRDPKKEKSLVLKADNSDSSGDETDMTYLTRRFQKQDHYKHNADKVARRKPVPDRRFKRRDVADNIVKQALASWGDSSCESKGEDGQGDSSMMAVESRSTKYDSLFALMAKSDDDEDNDDDAINFLDVQRNLKNYSQMKLISLENVLIDAYHNLINQKNILTKEIGEVEQERDDLVVVIVDLKKQVEEKTRKNTLLKNQMKKWMNTHKGKEMASEAQLKLERNKVEFLSKSCTITNLITDEVILVAKRFKNIYVEDFNSLNGGDLTCLSAIDDNAELWYKSLGHTSFSLLNKLIKKDLVRGLPKSKFKDHKVCDACVEGKQARSQSV
ncbi:kinetochore-associated protein DSN1-like [Nicotiana tomentosiformis]|uniref:kinetochore-associated protein DSN1-like n=1 Tax=Nicotiana tomentosiformis TaxID=4098 RepID=UPI00388CAA23